jgi:hypothetical protein
MSLPLEKLTGDIDAVPVVHIPSLCVQ